MARGFESKSVADQQESVQSVHDKPDRKDGTPEPDPAVVLKRRRLELARTDILHHLETARAEPHKEMLRRALAALEKDLSDLG